MAHVLIFGATSAIAQEAARIFARRGDRLFLVGRNAVRLGEIASDLSIRFGKNVDHRVADLSDIQSHASLLDDAIRTLGRIDTVLIAHGTLSDQSLCEADPVRMAQDIHLNFTSVAALLTLLATYFEGQKSGCIAVIGSVAGDRGRKSNYVYGSAKGALSIFLQGLRQRLFSSGVCVLTIKPGFVDTPMTAHMKKGALFASPVSVARGIVRAIDRKKNISYLPWFWFWIMAIISLVPERVFKRIKFL